MRNDDTTELKRAVSIRALILGAIALFVVAPLMIAGWMGFRIQRDAMEFMAREQFRVTNLGVADKSVELFRRGERVVLELEPLAELGALPLGDDRALGRLLRARLVQEPQMTWLSYSEEKTGRFVGVRKEGEEVVLNTSAPMLNGGRPREQLISESGALAPFPSTITGAYDPRTKPWYQGAIVGRSPVWSSPYLFNEGDAGITVALALHDRRSRSLLGVVTADFRLSDVEDFLAEVSRVSNQRVALVGASGSLLIGQFGDVDSESRAALADYVAGPGKATMESEMTALQLDVHHFNGKRYVVGIQRVKIAQLLNLFTASIADSEDVFRGLYKAVYLSTAIAALGLAAAVTSIWIVSGRISRPVDRLVSDFARIAQLDLDGESPRGSPIREVASLANAADRMKSSLRSFGRYVPKNLVRQLIASGEDAVLGGEEKELTLFFSDIAGFTSLSETLAPRVLVKELSEYFEQVTAVIGRHRGTVDKFIGDGVLAFFNAPHSVPDHAAAGCRAALEIQAWLLHVQREMQEGGRPFFQTRIGLFTGEVLVGNIGTEDRFSYSVIGDAVNIASRLEGLNKAYGTHILVGEEVRKAAGEAAFIWRRMDRVAVLGRKEGIWVHELIGTRVGPLAEGIRQGLEVFEEALDLYHAASFAAAAERFRLVTQLIPDDQPSLILAARCEKYQARPPEDWDGVHIATSK